MKKMVKKIVTIGMAACVALSSNVNVFAYNEDVDSAITSVFGDNGASDGYTYTELEDNYDNSNGETWDEYVDRVTGSDSSSSSSDSSSSDTSSSSSSSSGTSSSSSGSSSTSSGSSTSSSSTNSSTSSSSSNSASSSSSSSSGTSSSSSGSSSTSSGSSTSTSSSSSDDTAVAAVEYVEDTGNGTYAISADENAIAAGFSEDSIYTVSTDGAVYFVTVDDTGEYVYIWSSDGTLIGALCVVDEDLVIVDLADPVLINIGNGTYLNFTSEELAVYAAVMEDTQTILKEQCGYSGIAVNGTVLLTF